MFWQDPLLIGCCESSLLLLRFLRIQTICYFIDNDVLNSSERKKDS